MQRHLGARAAGTQARQPNVGRVAMHRNQDDVPPVRLQKRSDSIKNRLNTLLGDHLAPPVGYPTEGNGHAVLNDAFSAAFDTGRQSTAGFEAVGWEVFRRRREKTPNLSEGYVLERSS
jgi:hypothetical protein